MGLFLNSQFYFIDLYFCLLWELDYKESSVLKNWCFWTVVLKKTLESLLDGKEIQSVHAKGNQSWIFIGRTDAETETPILWPPDAKNWLIRRPWCWERLKVGGEGDDRGWDGWIASLTWWKWVWASSGSWWWTGRPGVLLSIGSQRVGHNRATELNWTELNVYMSLPISQFMPSPNFPLGNHTFVFYICDEIPVL